MTEATTTRWLSDDERAFDVCCPWEHETLSGYLVELVCEDGSTTLDFWTFKQVCRVMDVGTRALAPTVSDVRIIDVTMHACCERQTA